MASKSLVKKSIFPNLQNLRKRNASVSVLPSLVQVVVVLKEVVAVQLPVVVARTLSRQNLQKKKFKSRLEKLLKNFKGSPLSLRRQDIVVINVILTVKKLKLKSKSKQKTRKSRLQNL